MKVIQTDIPEVVLFEPKVFGDHRGYFKESFRQDIFDANIGPIRFVQDNQSRSGYGVLRGLHFQRPPYTQSKLVSCIQGKVLDVAVDMRIGSPTYGKHVAEELSEENHRHMFVPKGFAHGFVVLSKEAVFSYKCDDYYAPDYDGGIRFDDPVLGIDWRIPIEDMLLSEKDKKHPAFSEEDVFQYKNM